MNKRIEELADKAIEDMPGAWNIPDEFCKKFAELIVRECARVDSEMNNPDHVDGKSFNQTILEHFGVK